MKYFATTILYFAINNSKSMGKDSAYTPSQEMTGITYIIEIKENEPN